MDGVEVRTIDMNTTTREFVIDSDTYGTEVLELDIMTIDIVEESQASELYLDMQPQVIALDITT